ncbi:MAG: AraC family transcriptional regulator [Ruminococcus sp.]|nr:AraC family transcriptional regulator [Ruminococcus sp.]
MKSIENDTFLRNPAYEETKQHTDMMFAFNIYPCTIPADFAFVPIHWHNSMEIIYIKRGTGIVQIDFKSYTAESGDIFFVLPGHLHALRSIPKNRMEYENIIFDMTFLGSDKVDICSQKYLQPIINGKIQFPARIRKGDEPYPSVSACLDASDQLCSLRPNGYELGVKGHLMVLFSILFQLTMERTEKAIAAEKNVQKLKTVLLRIEKDYDKKLTVDQMADECGYSSSHFMRWFKEITGSGFAGYLIEYRLGKAALALRDTNDTILDISERNGFDNLSNFNRLFKKKYEMTPSQFRQHSVVSPTGQ